MSQHHDLVVVRHLGKQYTTAAGAVPVLHDLSFTIQSGEFVAIMGSSGSGKSTLLNILGCLDNQSCGDYILDGQSVAAMNPDQRARLRNRTIGFVFQGFQLLPRLNLVDNVALPLIYAAVPKAERCDRASALLQRMGLSQQANRLPSHISGGQQQRVAIARALINQPRLILADEPTGNLDSHTSHDVMALFQQLNRSGIAILLVTHEDDMAGYASRIIHLRDGLVAL
ncbi:MAG: ABC transporter ATP-binding protein [Magnetococcales bacterium]|nr:ABC transporter ATP-binding protein [Magnetococcales bacterium]